MAMLISMEEKSNLVNRSIQLSTGCLSALVSIIIKVLADQFLLRRIRADCPITHSIHRYCIYDSNICLLAPAQSRACSYRTQ